MAMVGVTPVLSRRVRRLAQVAGATFGGANPA